MSNRLGTFIGLVIILSGAAGVYFLFRQEPAIVEETEQQVQTIVPVKVAQVRRMTLHDYLRAYGSVVGNPGSSHAAPASVRINSPLDGMVTEVNCVMGQEVRKGQVLFGLYDRLARLAVEQAEKAVKFSRTNFERQKQLQQVQGTSTRLYQEAQQQFEDANNLLCRAMAELDLFKVTAPFDGTIMDVRVRVGEVVAQTDTMAQLMNLQQLVLKVDVPTIESGKLRLGQQVEIEAASSSVQSERLAHLLAGRLDYIDCRVDPSNDTVAVLVGLPADTNLRPGQVVLVRIITEEHRDRLAVPDESVVTTTDGQTVVAVIRGDEAVPTPVKVGIIENDWVEVEGQGVEPGASVVTEGAYGLPGRTKIRVIGP